MRARVQSNAPLPIKTEWRAILAIQRVLYHMIYYDKQEKNCFSGSCCVGNTYCTITPQTFKVIGKRRADHRCMQRNGYWKFRPRLYKLHGYLRLYSHDILQVLSLIVNKHNNLFLSR